MHKKLQQALIEWGMSEKEAAIYLAVFVLWSWQASAIGRKAEIKRATAYSILQDFVVRWIAHKTSSGKETIYSVIPPESLLAQKKVFFSELEKHFESLLPDFASLKDPFQRTPKVVYYEWTAWLKQFYETLLHSKTGMRSFLWPSTAEPLLAKRLNDDFMPRRMALEIHAQVLMCDSVGNAQRYGWHEDNIIKTDYTETKVIRHQWFALWNEIDLYDNDKISFVSYSAESQYAVVMTSRFFHDSLVSIFDLLRGTY